MAKSLMSNIRAEMGKQDEKRGLAKLMGNVQEVQHVQEVTPEQAQALIHEVQEVQEVQSSKDDVLIHGVQDVQDVQEVQSRRTQGRKGEKMPRAHISLSPAAYEYLSTMASSTGKTMSEYIENLLLEDKEKTPSYPQIRELIKATRKK